MTVKGICSLNVLKRKDRLAEKIGKETDGGKRMGSGRGYLGATLVSGRDFRRRGKWLIASKFSRQPRSTSTEERPKVCKETDNLQN